MKRSCLSVLALAIAPLAGAQIVAYNGPGVTAVRGTASPQPYADLDNGIATTGFSLDSSIFEIRLRYNTTEPFLGEAGDENPIDFVIQIGGGNTAYITAFNVGDVIGPGLNYRGPQGDRDGGFLVGDNSSGTITSVGSSWDNLGTPMIAGFTRPFGGVDTYGWIQVSYTFMNDINVSHELTIDAFAWEMSGAPILAGQFAAVPEPAHTAGILGVVALGGLIWRRRRQNRRV